LSVALTFTQVALDIVLVILLMVIWRRTRPVRPEESPRPPENWQQPLEHFLAEAEKLSAAFERNLEDKKNLSADLILKLDRRLSDYQALFKQIEAGCDSARKELAELDQSKASQTATAAAQEANPAAPEVRALVLQMAKKGHSPEEIAAKARLHLGEVELIIDLERQFSL
jgi:hypothetical protein